MITGGSGFIGCNLVDFYEQREFEVLNLSEVPPRNPAQQKTWKDCNVNDRDRLISLVGDFKPEFAVHLAARTDLDGRTLQDYETNIQGVQNAIDAINRVGTVKRALYASSRLVFKIDAKPKHDFDYSATTVYGESKIETEKIVLAQPSDNVPWLMFRPTSIWGEWFDIPYKGFFLMVAKNRYLHPRGHHIPKSYGYVGNSVYELDRYLHASDEDFNRKTYFVADYPPTDVMQWGTYIQKFVGAKPIREVSYGALRAAAKVGDGLKSAGMKNPPLTSFRLDNLTTPMVYDLSREEKICGPLPYSLEEATERTVKWLRDTGQV